MYILLIHMLTIDIWVFVGKCYHKHGIHMAGEKRYSIPTKWDILWENIWVEETIILDSDY